MIKRFWQYGLAFPILDFGISVKYSLLDCAETVPNSHNWSGHVVAEVIDHV